MCGLVIRQIVEGPEQVKRVASAGALVSQLEISRVGLFRSADHEEDRRFVEQSLKQGPIVARIAEHR